MKTSDINQPLPNLEELQAIADLPRAERQLLILKAAIEALDAKGYWRDNDEQIGYINGLIEAYRMITGELVPFKCRMPEEHWQILMNPNLDTVKGKTPS